MQADHADRLLGRSDAVRIALEDIGYATATEAKVLITGESGVGKEIAARLVHAGEGSRMLLSGDVPRRSP